MTQLIVALDAPVPRARDLYDALKHEVACFKVGVPLLLEDGGQRLARDIALWSRLMLDLKALDTRDTILRIMEQVERIGAHLVTVHEDCVAHAMGFGAAVLAVGMLTDGAAGRRGFARPTEGADGVVCSVLHAATTRSYHDKLIVCPGVRPAGLGQDNHAAAYSPRQAREAGVDYIVVGRPIIRAADPVAAATAILAELLP